MTALEALKAARAKIEIGWCREVIAKSSTGAWVSATSKEAISWCAVGALYSTKVSEEEGRIACKALKQAVPADILSRLINDSLDRMDDVCFRYNDSLDQRRVLEWFDRAINAWV